VLFLATLALVALRPRRIPAGVWTCAAGALMLAVGWVRLAEVGLLGLQL
jgi:Na+/H+ antiporter NhaD/arsenite permease-like protein